MTNLNQIHLIKHAWDATYYNLGKACIVLYYVFIWLQAI